MDQFEDIYRASIENPEKFWAEAAENIEWEKRWDMVLDASNPPFYRWYKGGLLNSCHNCLDRHVAAGHGDRDALIYESTATDQRKIYSYAELTRLTALCAGALRKLGVQKGDRVIIYMPMIPEAVIAMLACARLGAPHSVVFGGFAAAELAARIDDCGARIVISASGGIEPGRIVHYKPLLDAALAASHHKPEHCVIVQRKETGNATLVKGRDHDWDEVMAGTQPVDCVPVSANDPLYILYTSGTTGNPKGVVRDHGGHAVALNWTMRNFYGVEPGETFWAASDIGWVVGHSYIVYAPLLHGNTTILFEGKPVGMPDAGVFWRILARNHVAALFTAPTAIRAIRGVDPEAEFLDGVDLRHFRTLFLAGERCDPPTLAWAEEKLQRDVIDHWWQTETGWAICGRPAGLQSRKAPPGAAGLPLVGYRLKTVDEDGKETARNEVGALLVELPLPPGSFPTLWNADDRYVEAYMSRYPGHYLTGDAGFIDDDGMVHVMTRIDDVINVAGHRLSTGQLEEVIASHPAVVECAVIGVKDEIKGMVPLAVAVRKGGDDRDPHLLCKELVALVRERIGPVAALRKIVIATSLPKTRSGKLLRATMRRIAEGLDYTVPGTIEDPAALKEMERVLR